MAKKFTYDKENDSYSYGNLKGDRTSYTTSDGKKHTVYTSGKAEKAYNQEKIFRQYLDAILQKTREEGRRLENKELRDIIGEDNWTAGDDYYDSLYRAYINSDPSLLSSAPVAEAEQNAMAASMSIEALQQAFSGLQPQAITQQLNEQGLNADYQMYLDALNNTADIQYQTAMDELAREEGMVLRSIGLSQRQMERDIAKRRQQALKSGMSTAQLAAQEQQNILAMQTGAAQIAQQYADQRYSTINQFAGTQAQNYADVLSQQMQYSQGLEQFNAQQSANWASALTQAFPQYYAADKYEQK